MQEAILVVGLKHEISCNGEKEVEQETIEGIIEK
jgi:hypothetical protein